MFIRISEEIPNKNKTRVRWRKNDTRNKNKKMSQTREDIFLKSQVFIKRAIVSFK